MNKINNSICNLILIPLITTIIAFAIIEIIYRDGITSFISWIKYFPANSIYFLIFLFLLFASYTLLNYKGYFIASVLTSVLFSILAFSSHLKEVLRGDPLLPSDLTLVSEATDILTYFADLSLLKILVILLIVIVIIVLFIYTAIKIKNVKRKKQDRVTSFIFLLLLIGFVYQDMYMDKGAMKDLFNIEIPAYNQSSNYSTNGVVLSFIRNLNNGPEKPKDYSHEKVTEIIKDTETENELESDRSTQDKPNIIIIQSEAFWDPTIMESVNYNKDPIPNFHSLSSQFTSGTVTVPVYGGNTSNTEFEILTSLSTQFLPTGIVPYLNYVSCPLPALPNILGNQGYTSTALHTYHNWFYNRSSVYENLGFDNFLSLEFFPNPIQDHAYYRDNEITDEILKLVTNNKEPNFIFAVTMQAHGPYHANAKKYYASIEAELKDEDESFSSDAENILEYYADTLVEVDKELARLISSLEELDEDTIVVFYGDHLPLLGEDYQVYNEAGYFESEQDYADYQKIYQTPILIWNNFDTTRDKLNISPTFVGPYILELAGLEGNYLTNYLNQLNNQAKNYLPRFDHSNRSTLDGVDIDNYKILQYDILFGEKYGLKDNYVNYEPSATYRLGYADANIQNVELTTYNESQAYRITGEYFTTSYQVYINNEAVGSTFVSPEEVYAYVPDDINPETIVMKIFDSKNTLLSVSNKYQLK